MPAPTPPASPRPSSLRVSLVAAARLLKAVEQDAFDPLVPLWREWRKVAALLNRSCRRAQVLERRLMAGIGSPRIAVPLDPPPPQPVYASDADTIDQLLGTNPTNYSLRVRLKQELAELQARWEREADACGLSAAEAEELAASRRARDMLAAAAATPARSTVGVIAKLTIAAEWGRLDPDQDVQPWPLLHGALADLVNLAEAARSTIPPS